MALEDKLIDNGLFLPLKILVQDHQIEFPWEMMRMYLKNLLLLQLPELSN